jgi:DNA invertase Pin-like site-specific DNA recombinase
MTEHIRAGAYARSSDDKQETSCLQQREWARRKAAALNLDLVVQEEDEGIPGDRLDRPGLERLFAKLERHQKARMPVAVLLLFDQDRLSRATSWATGAIMDKLVRLGVERLVTASKEIDLLDDTSRAVFGLEQDLTKRGYAKSLSKNVSRAMAQYAALGCWAGGPAPYGYRIAGEQRNRHLVLGPPEEVGAVRELFRLAALGVMTLPELADLANEKGWPLPHASARQQGRRGAPRWTSFTVGGMLHNVAYVGSIRYGNKRTGKYHMAAEGEPVEKRGVSQMKAPALVREGCHEPLVDRETFDAVQSVLARRQLGRRGGRPRPRHFAFSGRLVCDACGKVMQGRTQGHLRGYICSTWRAHDGCTRNGVREDVLLDKVAALLADQLSRPATLMRLRRRLEDQQGGKGDTLRLALEKGKQHVADLEKRYEDGGKRLLVVSTDLVPLVEKQLRQVKVELDAARHDLNDMERQAAANTAEQLDVEELLSRLSSLPRLLRDAEPAKRNRVVQLAVDSVRLRFTSRAAQGRVLTKWVGATVVLRGQGQSYDMDVGGTQVGRWSGRGR